MTNLSAKKNADGTVDLTGKQGTTWTLLITIKQASGQPMDLTGYKCTSQVKRNLGSDLYATMEFFD